MANITYFMLFAFLLHSVSSEVYKIAIHTGDNWNAGTGDYVRVRIYGRDGYVSDKYNGFGPRFERNGVDRFEITGKDIGPITNIQVVFTKHLIFLDTWHLDKIKLEAYGHKYVGYFDYVLDENGESRYTRRFEVESCRSGYYASEVELLGKMRATCLDRNECLTTCTSSNEHCTNTPGSYICECKGGYMSDGTGCRDVDECTELGKNPCNYPHAYCQNLPGSYQCKCKAGYIGDHYACQDKDECKLNVHQCSQICINTPGSFHCDCKKGFKLAVDGKTCVDVDECSKPNPCNTTSSACYDEYGSYRCVCKAGYKPDPNKLNSCIPLTCDALNIQDKNLIISPSRCTSGKSYFGDECKVTCREGYYLDPLSTKSLVCGNGPMNGFERVNGGQPKCKPKLCPKISPPKNAYTVPPQCSTVGTEQDRSCYIYCDGEYRIAGDRKYHCSMQKYDKDSTKALCVKTPQIKCPADITRVLPSDQATMAIGNSYPNFETNMKMDQISSNIADVGPSYQFKRGMTTVQYIATNELNQTDSCSFVVNIKDATPPTVEYCPGDQFLTSKGGVDLRMTWNEPKFKDNVGIKRIFQNAKSGEMHQPSTLDVSYTAVDFDGNKKDCNFKIHVQILTCDFGSISGGDQLTQKRCVNLPGQTAICMAHCPFGKTFDIINSKSYLKYMWNCAKADFGVARMPDCVDFVAKTGACPAGYVDAKNYRLYNLPTVCGKCPRGTYYNNGTCSDCPVNTYQDVEGSLACNKCPTNKGTMTVRNIFQTGCKDLCPPGYFSKSGISDDRMSKCTMCPINTYSSTHGAKECTKCPNGTTTEGPGRTSKKQCLFAPTNVRMVPSGTIEATVGDHVQFDCYARGNPLPFMLISKAKSQANPKTHGLVTVGQTDADVKGLRYIITSVSKFDADIYICRAENKKGIVYKQINLKVNESSSSGSGSGMGQNDDF